MSTLIISQRLANYVINLNIFLLIHFGYSRAIVKEKLIILHDVEELDVRQKSNHHFHAISALLSILILLGSFGH